MEMVKDLTAEKQAELRTEVIAAYKFFGYEGQRLNNAVNRAMCDKLVEVTNLLGAYHWALDREREVGNDGQV